MGQFRGGLGQATRYSYRGLGDWSLSAMVDRTHFSAQGLAEGQPGALGEFKVDDEISR
ncbi:MAG UNVERIFIED_CONTAM: hydantoinase B/oxoprolinase family protein [Anaerolineae bacterium]